MILYHGSNISINVIDLSKSKRYKDFGRAFYLSAEREQAAKMAESSLLDFCRDAKEGNFKLTDANAPRRQRSALSG